MKDVEIWNKILTLEVLQDYMNRTGDGLVSTNEFFRFLQEEKDYRMLVILAMKWKSYEDTKQANIAIKSVGWERASRFVGIMDVLSDRFLRGELK